MKPLEEHLAEFILNYHREIVFRDYRRRCLECWRKEYGETFANKVEQIIRERWKK